MSVVVTINTVPSVLTVATGNEGMSMLESGRISSDIDGSSVKVGLEMSEVENDVKVGEMGITVRERAMRSLEEKGRSRSPITTADEDPEMGLVSRELVMSGKMRSIDLVTSGAIKVSTSITLVI